MLALASDSCHRIRSFEVDNVIDSIHRCPPEGITPQEEEEIEIEVGRKSLKGARNCLHLDLRGPQPHVHWEHSTGELPQLFS